MNSLVLLSFKKAMLAGWSPPAEWVKIFPEAFEKEENL